MKPFRFGLEKVLKIRQHQTLLAKHALAAAQLHSARAWAALEKARVEREAYEAAVRERQAKRMTAQEWGGAEEQRGRHLDLERALAEELHKALAEVVTCRRELEEAERREQTLEKLRDQQVEAHRNGELAEEQSLMDEIAQNAGRERKGVGMA